MAADFEISSLSGTGTATIRVKPKAVNEDMNNIKEQVLKVVVQGVEREVTLVQKAAPKIVETWGTYFSITPETTSHTFDGTKRGETLEIGVQRCFCRATWDISICFLHCRMHGHQEVSADWLHAETLKYP